jgi:hypothetical protein
MRVLSFPLERYIHGAQNHLLASIALMKAGLGLRSEAPLKVGLLSDRLL